MEQLDHERREGSDGDERVMEMFSIVAHELRTPLAVVEGYTSLVADLIGAQASQDGAGEALRQPVGELSRSVEVLGLMLDRLRDGWAADQGLRLRREPADLAAIVRETVDDLGSVLTEHPLEVAGPAEVAIDIDVPRIRQVLFNLLTNAEKYSDPGAPVLVTLVDGAEQVCLEVRNHGYGIATDDLEHIFARFSRVDDTAGGGLGIGLWLSRAIARAHGGELRAVPSAEEGSRFVLTLARGG